MKLWIGISIILIGGNTVVTLGNIRSLKDMREYDINNHVGSGLHDAISKIIQAQLQNNQQKNSCLIIF